MTLSAPSAPAARSVRNADRGHAGADVARRDVARTGAAVAVVRVGVVAGLAADDQAVAAGRHAGGWHAGARVPVIGCALAAATVAVDEVGVVAGLVAADDAVAARR